MTTLVLQKPGSRGQNFRVISRSMFRCQVVEKMEDPFGIRGVREPLV